MSRTHAKLRNLFDDALFVRMASGITPIIKALELDSRESNNQYFSEHVMKLVAVIYARKDHPLFSIDNLTLDMLFDYPCIGMNVEDNQINAFSLPIQKIS